MTIEHYKIEQKNILDTFRRSNETLDFMFAMKNNKYKEGDFFVDHIGVIQIESMRVSKDSEGIPVVVYFGTEFTKSFSPKKSGARREAYQQNEVK